MVSAMVSAMAKHGCIHHAWGVHGCGGLLGLLPAFCHFSNILLRLSAIRARVIVKLGYWYN